MHLHGVPDLSGQISILSHMIYDGRYSKVYKGLWRNREVVVKIIRLAAGSSMDRKIQREVTTMCSIEHPNIVPCFGFARGEGFGDFGAIISLWCKNGDAANYLTTKPSLPLRVKLLRDIVNGVSYLHQADPIIVHGDLKPANIFINDQYEAQIGDFGLVRLIRRDGRRTGITTTSEYTGTPRYLAYELLEDHALPTTASDIYALACIAMMFIYSQEPYAGITSKYKIYRKLEKGVPPATRPSDLKDTMSTFWSFLERCWSVDPKERPSIQEFVTFLETWSNQIADQ